MSDESGGGEQPIVIKKIVKGGGHHGGAWKVAYADFVTAMMAFFLLMWLLSMASDEQLNGIADYFSPTVASVSDSGGAGGVMGGTSMSTERSMISDTTPMFEPTESGANESLMNAARATQDTSAEQAPAAIISDSAEAQAIEELKQVEEQKLQSVKDDIENAIADNPNLSELAENLLIDMTPEGLRIQVVDAEGKPMFASGSARMFERTRELMNQVGKAIGEVPNEISIRGHTDSIPYGSGASYTNWELSTDRANSSRRTLQDSGIAADRLNNVVGKSDTEHLLPDDPTNARNRRISIVLLREELTDPEQYQRRVNKLAAEKRKSIPKLAPEQLKNNSNIVPSIPAPASSPFERTDGDVQFP